MSGQLVELNFAITYSGTRFAVGFMPCSSLDSVIKTNEEALEHFKQRIMILSAYKAYLFTIFTIYKPYLSCYKRYRKAPMSLHCGGGGGGSGSPQGLFSYVKKILI